MFKKRRPDVGARPGTLAIAADSPLPKVHLFNYSPSEFHEQEVTDTSELGEAHSDQSVTWIDVQGFGDPELIRRVGEVFEFHPLLLEDVVNVPQRPKVDPYGDQLLCIVRMVRLDGRQQMDMEQVSVVLGKNYVITFQERYGDVLDPVRQRIRGGQGNMRKLGADYLAYALLDTIIDGHYPVLEVVGERLEKLEDEVVIQPSPELLHELNRTKNRLVNLRRSIWPEREAIRTLAKDDSHLISDAVRVYLRDTYDHCVQTSEMVELYRETVSNMMNTYLSSVANRTNEVMKVLTIVATIFIPLTFLAGVYGMNFKFMPELTYRFAYPLFWVTNICIAIGMFGFFWWKGWLRRRRARARRDES